MKFWETYVKLCSSVEKKPTQVGREVGVSSASVTQWKNGSVPSGEKLVQIADYFNVTTDYLLGRTSEPDMPTELESYDNNMPVPETDSERDKTAEEFMQMFKTLPLMDRIEIMSLARDKVKQSNIAV